MLSFATELTELEGVADADVRSDKDKQFPTYNKESEGYKTTRLEGSYSKYESLTIGDMMSKGIEACSASEGNACEATEMKDLSKIMCK